MKHKSLRSPLLLECRVGKATRAHGMHDGALVGTLRFAHPTSAFIDLVANTPLLYARTFI